MRRVTVLSLLLFSVILTAEVTIASPVYYTFQDQRGDNITLYFKLDFAKQGYRILDDGTIQVFEDVPYTPRNSWPSIRPDLPNFDYFYVEYIGGSAPLDANNRYFYGESQNSPGLNFIYSNGISVEEESGSEIILNGIEMFNPHSVSDWRVGDRIWYAQINSLDWAGSSVLTEISLNNPVPEPATMLLLASGLVGLAGFRRKFKK